MSEAIKEAEKIASRLRTEKEITLYSFLEEVMFQRSVELTDK